MNVREDAGDEAAKLSTGGLEGLMILLLLLLSQKPNAHTEYNTAMRERAMFNCSQHPHCECSAIPQASTVKRLSNLL